MFSGSAVTPLVPLAGMLMNLAMMFSLGVAFIITPWAALRVLGRHALHPTAAHAAELDEREPDTFFTRLYHRIMEPLIGHARWRWTWQRCRRTSSAPSGWANGPTAWTSGWCASARR